MRFSDILGMCLDNLTRRKGRTFLTILGVFIGCTSIIIMVSIGMGMKESTDKMLKEMGDLTVIQVYQGGTSPMGGGSAAKLDDKAVKAFKGIAGVQSVIPKLQVSDLIPNALAGINDRYKVDSLTLIGIDINELETAGYKLLKGSLPTKPMEAIAGQYFAYDFIDTYMPEGRNMIDRWQDMGYDGKQTKIPDPYIDILSTPLTLQFMSEDQKSEQKEQITVKGILKEDYGKGPETSDGLLLSINDMKELAKKITGKHTTNFNYSDIIVKVKDIKDVSTVEQEIKNLNYSTFSMESIRKEVEKNARQVQLMLGGLGAISLFVAAIGITNTMIMSISERTKEIGVMKALGCYVKDIRKMFLMESGAIGLIGGAFACLVSFATSIIINVVSFKNIGHTEVNGELIYHAIFGGEDYSRLSVVPLTLLVFSIFFSIFVGLVSGYYPANKAVKITALEAIKTD